MAWSRLFEMPALGWAIRRLRAFPVQLQSRDPGAARAATRILGAGEALMIFPEGERSLDGTVRPFKLGAFRLAASLGVPTLPVTIEGGTESWPPGRILPRPGRITITYHPLVEPDRSLDPRRAAADLAERTRAVIIAALGRHATRS
jgi:1-acyl-sn-glycerol-3-phosphate acyltransferase